MLQIIDHEGEWHSMQHLLQDEGLASSSPYSIVAIMGPQSSGKSTLLNHAFGTAFREMDASAGRSQTTQGVWLSRSPRSPPSLPTLVLDIEGSDSRERGEDDAAFERKTALLAIAVADQVLVNMWCHDVGREQGSGKQLLRTVLTVNLKLFRPEAKGASSKRRTRLLFVLRDRTKTPLDKLRAVLQDDLDKLWAGMSKPAGYEDAALEDFFELDFLSLPNYDLLPEDFEVEAQQLRDHIAQWAEQHVVPQFAVPGARIPASALSVHMSKAWEVIRSDRDLNLPAHRIMVASIRCEEIAAGVREATMTTEGSAWSVLAQECKQGRVADFGSRARAIVGGALEAYDSESAFFDPKIRALKREGLLRSLVSDMAPAIRGQVKLLSAHYLERLSAALEAERAKTTASVRKSPVGASGTPVAMIDVFAQFRPFPLARVAEASLTDLVESFSRDAWSEFLVDHDSQELKDLVEEAASDLDARMKELVASLRAQLTASSKEGIRAAAIRQFLTPQVAVLLDKADVAQTWAGIRSVTAEAIARAGRALRETLSALGVSQAEVQVESSVLEAAVLESVRSQCREAAAGCQHRMRDRFLEKFNYDTQGLPRTWTPSEDIARAALEAKVAAAEVLATFAVMRWTEPEGGHAAVSQQEPGQVQGARRTSKLDVVQRTLYLLADPGAQTLPSVKALSGGSMCDAATSLSWPAETLAEELGLSDTVRDVVLSPQECRRAWEAFKADVNVVILQAQNAQQTALIAGNRGSLPIWVWGVFLILGWNEMRAVLMNPLLATVLLVVGLFLYTLYQELDIDRELQRGLLPGLISLAGKFPTALQRCQARLLESIGDTLRATAERGIQELQGSGAGHMHRGASPEESTGSNIRGASANAKAHPSEVELVGGPHEGVGDETSRVVGRNERTEDTAGTSGSSRGGAVERRAKHRKPASE